MKINVKQYRYFHNISQKWNIFTNKNMNKAMAQNCANWIKMTLIFVDFRKWNMGNHKSKMYVTKVKQSKIRNDSFLAFSVAFVVVYSVFSVGAVFTEIFADQNRHFWKFPKKRKMGLFVRQNSPLRDDVFCFFSHPSSWPVQELRFAPPNFDRGLKTRISSDDRWAIENDHLWSIGDHRWKSSLWVPDQSSGVQNVALGRAKKMDGKKSKKHHI